MSDNKQNKLNFLDWLMADNFCAHKLVMIMLKVLKANRDNMKGDYDSVKNFFLMFKGKIDHRKLNFTLLQLEQLHSIYVRYLNNEFEVQERIHKVEYNVTQL